MSEIEKEFRVEKIYTPIQIGIGTFFGGPLAATYFFQKNFLAAGDARKRKIALITGISFSVALALLCGFLPLSFTFIPIVYTVVATQWAKMMFPKESIEARYPVWNVIVVAVLGLVVFCVVGFPIVMLETMVRLIGVNT